MRPEGVSGESLRAAATGIAEIEAGRLTLDEYLDRREIASFRKIVAHLLLTYFRRKRALDARVNSFITRAPRPEVAALLRAAATRIFFQTASPHEITVSVAVDLARKFHADKFVNAVLRRLLEIKSAFPDAPNEVLPPEIFRRWSARFAPEFLQNLTRLFLEEAPFSYRAECGDSAIPDSKTLPGFGNFSFFTAPAAKVLTSSAMKEGKIYIQDPAASFAVSLIDPDGIQSAADLCAAPGGKALMLAQILHRDAGLFLFDASAKRQMLTRENFALRQIKANIRVSEAQKVRGVYDLVVADVPCSNTGVFRRRPDALWRFDEVMQKKLLEIQQEILFHAATLVSPGGQLLLSSCSIEEEENTFLAEKLEAAFPAFRRMAGGIILPEATRDGAGAFIWRKES
ncbi:MAG: hypothetical protein MJ033_04975 [Victivallaceae bacterium]|nr:hypothetical protein [Victivallaceae bacterium]